MFIEVAYTLAEGRRLALLIFVFGEIVRYPVFKSASAHYAS